MKPWAFKNAEERVREGKEVVFCCCCFAEGVGVTTIVGLLMQKVILALLRSEVRIFARSVYQR